MKRRLRILLAVGLVAATSLATSASQAQDELPARRATLAGHPTVAPDGVTPAEKVVLAPDLLEALLAVPIEGSIRLIDWPLEPGVRREVVLTRHDVYATDARLVAIDEGGEIELPRSSLRFLWGEVEGAKPSSVVLSVDPNGRVLHGRSQGREGWVELRAIEGREEYTVAPSIAFAPPETAPLELECAQASLPRIEPRSESRFAAPLAPSGTLYRATIAVDTDNELLLLKFADNTTSATNYIASLFAVMTAVYERDLGVRLLQGATFLRISSTADPYLQSGTGNASPAKLDEFRNYWNTNFDNISRALAMMLSGKQGADNSASGIAYVNSLCEESSGYSFTQVFKFAENTASSDLGIVGHENGHNFGSEHTHCYLTPTPIDTCNNTESGCYAGPTSCPAPTTINGVPNVEGTLMSYCHLLGGCSAEDVFHPRTVEILSPIVASKVGICIFVVANPKEASPGEDLRAERLGSQVNVTYTPACGATDHTLYAGNLATLQGSGISWSQRHCFAGTSGTFAFNPGAGSVYFVVVANNGSIEGSYGQSTTGERPPAGAGPTCQYTQDLSGPCP